MTRDPAQRSALEKRLKDLAAARRRNFTLKHKGDETAHPRRYKKDKQKLEASIRNNSNAIKARQTKSLPSAPKPPLKLTKRKLLPFNKPISIRDFDYQGKSLTAIFNEIEKDPAKFDALKLPEERWAFQIEGTDSLKTWPDIESLIEHVFKRPYGNNGGIYNKRQKSVSLGKKLKIIRWNTTQPKRANVWAEQRKIRGVKAAQYKAKKRAEKRKKK